MIRKTIRVGNSVQNKQERDNGSRTTAVWEVMAVVRLRNEGSSEEGFYSRDEK